jgi:TRAP-type mannitol/chloroaromatic compound transport system permease large subunit
MLGMGLANLIWRGYGQQFLQTMASVYFGYHATRSIAEVIVGTLYGTVDGLVGGAVFAWLYNQFVRSSV